MSGPMLQLNSIRKRFGDNEVLCGIDLDVERGEFITLLGSSGCGKTSLLRIVAGLHLRPHPFDLCLPHLQRKQAGVEALATGFPVCAFNDAALRAHHHLPAV